MLSLRTNLLSAQWTTNSSNKQSSPKHMKPHHILLTPSWAFSSSNLICHLITSYTVKDSHVPWWFFLQLPLVRINARPNHSTLSIWDSYTNTPRSKWRCSSLLWDACQKEIFLKKKCSACSNMLQILHQILWNATNLDPSPDLHHLLPCYPSAIKNPLAKCLEAFSSTHSLWFKVKSLLNYFNVNHPRHVLLIRSPYCYSPNTKDIENAFLKDVMVLI